MSAGARTSGGGVRSYFPFRLSRLSGRGDLGCRGEIGRFLRARLWMMTTGTSFRFGETDKGLNCVNE